MPLGEPKTSYSCERSESTPLLHDWGYHADLVERIRLGDALAAEEFVTRFQGPVRYIIAKRTRSNELDDLVQSTLLITIQAILSGDLRDPSRVVGFLQTVAKRQAFTWIESQQKERARPDVEAVALTVADPGDSPERQYELRQQAAIIQQALAYLTPLQRDILNRFYLLEQPAPQIIAELGLTETQFRLCKSRAKGRLVQISHKIMAGSRKRSQSLNKIAA